MLLFGACGFACFVGAVLFFLWGDDRSMRKEFQIIGQHAGEIRTLKTELTQLKGSYSFLMNDRNKMFLENKDLKAEVEKLHDNCSAQISTQRELSLRQDWTEKHLKQSVLPTSIEVFLIDKPKQPVSKSKSSQDNKAGKINEQEPSKPKQAPRSNQTTSETPKRKVGLGRSYSDVENRDTRRVPPSSKRGKGLNL